MNDVMILHWPSQAIDAKRFTARGVACLLLVDADSDPPFELHPLADWERLPADGRDIANRLRRLKARGGPLTRPSVDGHRRLHFGDAWVALSPIEARIAESLVSHFDEVVPDAALVVAGGEATPHGRISPAALRVHLTRLRQRVAVLGLTIRVVRGQGHVLTAAATATPGTITNMGAGDKHEARPLLTG
jgi:Transcriptional regulatory protein, C terminal